MLYDRLLIKYGELTIKGKNKQHFIQSTIRIIREKCKKFPNLEYIRDYERFYIVLNGESYDGVIEALKTVFGLYSFSLVAKCPSEIEAIKATALEIVKEQIVEPTSFKVETSRADKRFPIQSTEVSKEVARFVLRQSPQLSVDVRNPKVTLKVEIRVEGTYISTQEIFGLGGLPVGIDGKGLLMLSGGIDSPVAGFLIQKRGVAIDVIHYASPPFTSDKALEKVLDLTEKLTHYAPVGKINVHVVPFTQIQKAIHDLCPSPYLITIMRRMMYRIAERVAEKIKALVIVNGENVGQVASQTLYSMRAINSVTNFPIIRPCATMDKIEIIKIAKSIDTYDISIRPFEDCCTIFVPENPTTRPLIELCEEYERAFDFESMIKESLAQIEVLTIVSGEKSNLISDNEINDLF